MATDIEHSSQADFFVHPDFHRLGGYTMSEGVEDYEAALQERITGSQLPILIYNPGHAVERGDFWDRFPPEQRFPTLHGRGTLHGGYETQAGFNRLLDEREVLEGVVHGSYLEACVRAFKGGLRAFGKTGVLYTRSPYEIGYIGDIVEPEIVKYGVVLRDDDKRPRPMPEFQNLGIQLPPRYYAKNARIFPSS